jgi:pimeloyl-ACP methyl ester carboxylesterase
MPESRTSDQVVRLGDVQLRVRSIEAPGASVSDPVLVFLHDSLGCVDTWRDFPGALARRVGLTAIVYDRRGYGQSSPFGPDPRTPYYLEDEARVLFQLLDALEIGPVVLFGHSDGGSISLIAAAEHADRVRAVVTEGAHVFVEDITLAGIRDARAMFVTTDLATRLARYHGDKVAGIVSAWTETWLSPEFRDWNIESYLTRVQCPTLVIQGNDDEFGTPAQVDAIVRGIGNEARSLIIPGVGHTPHRDARTVVLDAASSFIAASVQ